MKYSTALCGKKLLISPYNCAASVLLWLMTSVGFPYWAMTLAIVIVLPEPVTPSSAWKRSFRSSPAISSAIALGWSPAGLKGASSWKLARGMEGNVTVSGFVREGGLEGPRGGG